MEIMMTMDWGNGDFEHEGKGEDGSLKRGGSSVVTRGGVDLLGGGL